MKKILFLLFLLISISARAETYYIKTGGSDAADGLTDATAWETITKVNTTWAAGTFAPGDSILFNKGNSFYGTITITESGTAGSPIYIGSYGTGADPIITGFQTLSSWTDAGGSIYYATLSSADDTTTMVTVDGVHTAMGRYPDSGTNLTFESHSTTVSITDTGIGDATDWAGADIVINKNWWILERARIKDHTGDVFTYQVYSGSSTSYVFDDRYYFIQNDLRTVTATNEWWHDYANSRLYIYGNPATKTVKAAALNYLINVGTHSDYITIDGLNLQGSIRHAINIGNELGFYGNNNNIIVKNCNIDFAGLCGISAWVSNVASAVCEFDGNTISHTGANGIFFRGNNIIVTDNNISYAGVVPGLSFKGNDNQGISAQGSASPSTITISRNNITYTGYNGIGVYYSVTGTTSYNYIAYAMQLLDDGGGIYYGSYSPYERIIDHNIILYTGRDNTANAYIARGLYLDSGADAATVTNNTIAHTLACGIALHSGDNNVIRNNLSYDNGYDFTFEVGQIVLYEDTDYPSCTLNTITNNQFIAKLAKQRAFIEDSFDAAEAILLGTTDSNYYARPIDNDMVMYYQADSATLATWQTFSSQDAHSSQGTETVADTSEFYFKYNNSLIAVTYDLTEPKIDIEGNKYTYEFTLQPFESIVLFTDPAGIYTPTGLGWDPVYKKMNFKDEVNFVQGIKINGVPVIVSNELSKLSGLTATAGELNVLDGVDQTLDATEINTIKGATGNLQGQINALDVVDDSKADTSLSNLSSVAINTHLLPATSGSANLGSALLPFGSVYANGTVSLPSTTSIGSVSSTEIGYVNNVTSAIQTQFNATKTRIDSIVTVLADTANIETLLQIDFDTDTLADLSEVRLKLNIADSLTKYVTPSQLSDSIDAAVGVTISDVRDEIADSLNVLRPTVRLLADTIPLFVFGAGGYQLSDTAVFSDSTIYGAFYNSGSDTLVITQLKCIMLGVAGDSLAVDINWSDTLQAVVPVELNTTPHPFGYTSSGNVGSTDTSFNNTKIPPGKWVWCDTPGVWATKKPYYFNAQISGYKIPKY